MILNKADPVAEYFQKIGEPVYLIDSNPTAENIAKLIYDFAKSHQLPVAEVSLWETFKSYATYRD
jgi:6-pyruvoyltetrahydropterin/6-carboxytetrahydropterin synthase